MNKKTIQDLIPKAMQAIEGVGIVGKDKKFEKVHEGYINALGPNIIQSGLLPTLIFYNKDERKLWLKALYYMEIISNDIDPTAIIQLIIKEGDSESRQEKTLKELEGKAKKWERKILEYAVALKLALRTFVAEEPETSNTEQQQEGGAQ
ncbi:type III-B CRISPR module-associated protein Cmr5 [Porphyromonas gingivalis]|uniref:type III-B CRISPR module-associated protein Cmr5 n=1 Tax=Porphyromonas gingivalis TaxID=837 RepID=UPI00265AC163|nr:type III-B CRISPR module-associated protein Cmr5 [Porphyromonas gingivalis]MDP0530397.1 type III-B CRISPR module-associated protein Cmr5 [Porphyromonas gingivalis]MDP0623879.1 type III-B CRISPR module-associated protein Cmr5 [Porphyromonas gingivalis]WKD52577.1 type III-B CRISPR module-associated protein Cmr5 [Porphyromonas gingivalis]WKD54627.1 type III-B CRISPR module-associated protein Cmr5 [Porphyromonas gingivalis]